MLCPLLSSSSILIPQTTMQDHFKRCNAFKSKSRPHQIYALLILQTNALSFAVPRSQITSLSKTRESYHNAHDSKFHVHTVSVLEVCVSLRFQLIRFVTHPFFRKITIFHLVIAKVRVVRCRFSYFVWIVLSAKRARTRWELPLLLVG